jgi:N4-gp56 family major capsid protein
MASFNVPGNTNYGDISPRTAIYAQKEFLRRALPFLVIEKFGQGRPIPSNASKTTKFRRYEAIDPTPNILSEGVTPSSKKLVATDVTATLVQYGDLITISDVVMDTHEDPVLNEAVTVLGEQAAQMIETIRFNQLIAGTNVQYANGSSRSAVNTALTLAMQRKATRTLKRQNARPITTVVRSTPSYETANVAAAFIGLVHPDLENDIRNFNTTVAGSFVPVERYGTLTPYENEIGKAEDVRYLSSTIFTPFLGAANAGGTVGAMIPNDITTANAMVYPILFIARDAYGIVPLKGMNAITPTVVNPKPSDSDPLAQRGHVGWKSLQAAVILNDAFMVRLETAVTL